MRLQHALLTSSLLVAMFGIVAPVSAQTTEPTVVVEDVGKFTKLLATADLKAQGITNPTPEQLATSTQAIQAKRTSGMGWGEIAKSLGLNFGALVSAYRSERGEKVEKAEKPEKSEHASHAENANKGKSELAKNDSTHSSSTSGSGKSGGGGGGGGSSGGRSK